MASKAEKARLNTVVRTRVTDEIANMLQAKAVRENIDMATVVREIIYQYFEDAVNDTKIISQTMVQTKRKLSMLENKIEVMSLLVLELAKAYSTTFPRRHLTEEISEKFYEEMITNLSSNMRNHKGLLESMVLDIYEKQGGM